MNGGVFGRSSWRIVLFSSLAICGRGAGGSIKSNSSLSGVLLGGLALSHGFQRLKKEMFRVTV